jgi:hypothetical protein
VAVRTTEELVDGVLGGDRDDSIDVTPFIEAASSLVDEVCVPLTYSDAQLLKIETWLSAHFYCVFDPRTTLEHAGDVRVFYEGKAEMAFDFTRYGQMAKLLDYKGGLAALQNAQKDVKANLPAALKTLRFNWLGTTPT